MATVIHQAEVTDGSSISGDETTAGPGQFDKLEALQDLLQQIEAAEKPVDVRYVDKSGKNPLLHLSHDSSVEFSDIAIGHAFYLVAQVIDGGKQAKDASLHLQLVAFNGKRLHSHQEKFSVAKDDFIDKALQSNLFTNFVDDDIRLCKGVPEKFKCFDESESLRDEYQEEGIVVRSKYCSYGVVVLDDTESEQICFECKTHMEIKREPGSMRTRYKTGSLRPKKFEVEDLLEDDDDEEADYYDEYGYSNKENERLAKKKIKKLSGITIAKTDEDGIPIEEKKRGRRSKAADDPPQTPRTPRNPGGGNFTLSVTKGRRTRELEVPLEKLKQEFDFDAEMVYATCTTIPQPSSVKKRKRATPESTKRRNQKVDSDEPCAVIAKNCPICDQPFSEINEFMEHLTKCDYASDNSGDENGDTKDGIVPELDEETGEPKPKRKRRPRPKKEVKKKVKKEVIKTECCICLGIVKGDENAYPNHMKGHEEKVDLSLAVQCPECDGIVPSRKECNAHIKEAHPERGSICIECLEFMPVFHFYQMAT